MKIILAVILFFEATAYAPDSAYSESRDKIVASRYINGDKTDSWGMPITKFTMACSLEYHGYIFVFYSPIPESQVRYCTDSVEYGLKPKRIDIAITEGSNDERNAKAFDFGRKQIKAKVISAKKFLECRGFDLPDKRLSVHYVVISLLYIDSETCL